jgi:hypothetical protein
MSAAQLEAARSAYRTEQADLAAAQSELATLAATARQGWGPVLGEALLKGAPLANRLIAREELLLQVTLRPGETAAGDPADAYLERDDGSHVALRYVSPATRTDARIQGLSLLFTAPAAAGLLPGMSIQVWLPGGRALSGVLLPPAAVVWAQGAAWAYFKSGERTFVRRRIPTAGVEPGGYVVSEPDGSEVVVQGAQLLLSEEQRAQIRLGD